MTETDALQAALAGEHAASYAIGVAGGHLRGSQYTAVAALSNVHLDRRDRLAELVVAAGATPVAAQPAYQLPSVVTDIATAAALIRLVEQRLAAVYGDLVEAASTTPVRTFAVQSLVMCARQQALWGGSAAAFPGSV